MKFCVIIPCYNHADTVNGVAASIGEGLGVIVVDDGSSPPVRLENDRCVLVRLEKNGGKAGALKRGFEEAKKLGYTHAVTMDADRQHPPAYLDEFVRAAKTFQHEIILGTRDFDNPAVPRGRRFLNKFSNFWLRQARRHPVRIQVLSAGRGRFAQREIPRLRVRGRAAREGRLGGLQVPRGGNPRDIRRANSGGLALQALF